MTKVLLASVNSFMDNLIPIGTSLLSSCLKQAGHETALFDTTFYRTREETGDEARVKSLQIKSTNLNDVGVTEERGDLIQDFQKQIRDYKPDLIGLSVVESTYPIALDLLNSIKGSGIPTIVGGIHSTMALEDILKEDSINMICVGEGEGAIVDLAGRLERGSDYADVQNIWLKRNGQIIKNPLRPLVNLDNLPDQDWSIYNPKRLFKSMGGKIWISGPIELDRGCNYHCAFCCNDQLQATYKGIGKYPRQRSLDRFFGELRDKKERFNLQYLYLVAENFLQMNDERFNEFIERYQSIRLPFWIETRPETINPDRIKKLKEVGCEGLSIGVEHGNNNFRRTMLNRYVSNERLINAFKIAKASGIRVCANNIIGFPDETRDLIFDTINLNRELCADNSIANIFCAYRGTKLWRYSVDKGYIPHDGYAGDYRSDAGLDMPQLSSSEIKGLQRTFPLYIRFPKEIWPQIKIAEKFDEKGNQEFERLSKMYREQFMK